MSQNDQTDMYLEVGWVDRCTRRQGTLEADQVQGTLVAAATPQPLVSRSDSSSTVK